MCADLTTNSRTEQELLDRIDYKKLPVHIAVIMDGNGRWAKKRGLPRIAGHRAGIKSVRSVIETSAQLGVQFLTLYAFSKENWQRPAGEVNYLMGLIEEYVLKELDTLCQNNIRFHVLGRMSELSPSVQARLEQAIRTCQRNTGMVFNVALNYGSRIEIADACRTIAHKVKLDELKVSEINDELISQYLYTAGQPDPDLLIRTSGEFRISNFLLWQLAYAEIFVTPVLWPDFRKSHLFKAIIDYQTRERRFGKVLSP